MDLPKSMAIEDIVAENLQQMKAVASLGRSPEASYLDTPAGKVGKIIAQGTTSQLSWTSTAYMLVKDKTLAIVTFSGGSGQESALSDIADKSIKTFRFD